MCIGVHIINKYVFLKDKDFLITLNIILIILFHDSFFLHKFSQVCFLSLSAWVSDLHPDTFLMIWWPLASCSYLATGHRLMHTNCLEAQCRWVGLLSTVFPGDRSSAALALGTFWYCKLDCLPGWSDPQRMLSPSCAWPVPRPSTVGTELGKRRKLKGPQWAFFFFDFLRSPAFSAVPHLLGSGAPSPETPGPYSLQSAALSLPAGMGSGAHCCLPASPDLASSSPAAVLPSPQPPPAGTLQWNQTASQLPALPLVPSGLLSQLLRVHLLFIFQTLLPFSSFSLSSSSCFLSSF